MRKITVRPGHWLEWKAGKAYLRGVARGGFDRITSAGRTRARQTEIFKDYFTTNYSASAKFDPRWFEGKQWWRRPGKPSASTPGSRLSYHETGEAIDIPEPDRTWWRKYGHYYGFIKDLVPGEKWHFQYIRSRDLSFWRKVKVNGTMNGATHRAVNRALGRLPKKSSSAKAQRTFWKAVQRQINRMMKGTKNWKPLVRDGYPGPKTIRGLQSSLRKVNPAIHRPAVDGSLGPQTVKAWQYALNARKWGRTRKQIDSPTA